MTPTGADVLGGRYTLLAVLGTGGMATVWRARDEMLGRAVAVKVLSPQHAADPEFLARFEREARHAAAVSHPRLVTVFDCGVEGGTPFIVMELVEGRTLRQVLDETGVLPPGQAVTVAAAVCEGLEAAHSAGLVHRDITPANIVLNGGEVKILDFGIARVDGTRAATATGTVLGTAAYLSPEQASGQPAGPRSDLYSLGCVLFEMLTGRPPFTADSTVGLAYRQVHDDPGPPSALRPGLSPRLDQVTGQLLAKDPAARPPGAAAARAGLLGVLGPGGNGAASGTTADSAAANGAAVNSAAVNSAAVNSAAVNSAAPDKGTAVLDVTPDTQRRERRPRTLEAVLGVALAATLVALTVALLTRPSGGGTPAGGNPVTAPAQQAPTTSAPPTTLSSPAAAAAILVGDLKQGVTDGQVTQQAGQQIFQQLQQLLFPPPGQDSQQLQQQYSQLVQQYTQARSQGQVTGQAVSTLSGAISALGAALGTL